MRRAKVVANDQGNYRGPHHGKIWNKKQNCAKVVALVICNYQIEIYQCYQVEEHQVAGFKIELFDDEASGRPKTKLRTRYWIDFFLNHSPSW